jgi:hypothetical protein
MPAYNDTPLATQQINQTQLPIRTNFQTLSDAFNINHVPFADPVDFGKHNVTQFIGQLNTPLVSVPAFITGLPTREFNIYNTIPNGNAVLTGVPNQGYPVTLTTNELIIERSPVAPETLKTFIPITATNQFNDATGQHGWAFLPSGILIKWGYVFSLGNLVDAAGTFTYPVNGAAPNGTIPAFNNVWSVNITGTSAVNGVATQQTRVSTFLNDFTNTQILLFFRGQAFAVNPAPDFTYLSIGTAQTNT